MKGKHNEQNIPAMVVPHRCYPFVYIAGPIRSDPITGARRALEVGGRMVKEDRAVPIVVHAFYLVNLMGVAGFPTEPEEWLHLDAEYIKRADAVYRISGESPGADRECEFAEGIGIPVFNEEVVAGAQTDGVWDDFCQWSSLWAEDEAGC